VNVNPTDYGYAAVEFLYNSNNYVKNCTFNRLRNRGSNYIHAVYVAHGSSNNRICLNKIYNTKPDPIRFRDNSNNNRVYQNNFICSGYYAYVSEWYNGEKGEVPSDNNAVYRNKFYGKFREDGKEFDRIDAIAVFKPNTVKKIDLKGSKRLWQYKNKHITSKKDSQYDKNTFISSDS
jgi:hypothetical protein